jgi:glycosyltransferase involved in cell wall biosynthesis
LTSPIFTRQAPVVSVLMPVYNAERYLKKSLDSICVQTFHEFEFIIVDDGSTDGSYQVLKRYEQLDARIRLFRNETNIGVSQSLNRGLEMATGRYIARMDADDICLPERFAKQVAYLDAQPSCVAVGANGWFIDGEGERIGYVNAPTHHDDILAGLASGNGAALPHPVAMFRKESMRAISGYRNECTTAEDVDLYFRLAKQGKLANVPDRLYLYRQHFSSSNYLHAMQQRRVLASILETARSDAFFKNLYFCQMGTNLESRVGITRGDFELGMADMALRSGFHSAAHRHALRALSRNPISLRRWRMIHWIYRDWFQNRLPRVGRWVAFLRGHQPPDA